ncbi:hypothetical protein Rxycam_01831 [Rubrobacter xylanophilus DSM 9941]|uniref:hypothetical protein n=1 Tax=Rubrobacter xylanophilus TaxID=49319 RepID=UPI001C63DA88|nr:hypothetical protein [Rubrobacter xylanophilus]QYJ16001.1 hypothetical protein Rxycam_01831 [Rubrobacter xylanophilus DSM 9941]
MNAFNRLILLLLALLLLAVPAVLLLVNYGVLPAETVDRYTGYRAGLEALGGALRADLSSWQARLALGAAGVVLALLALILLLRELTLGRRVARKTVIDDTPGAETAITARAVRSLAESAAREAGAADASISLSGVRRYLVECRLDAPEGSNYTALASRARENIRKALESQRIPVRDVEVTVRGLVER